jgi:hypothetical protein
MTSDRPGSTSNATIPRVQPMQTANQGQDSGNAALGDAPHNARGGAGLQASRWPAWLDLVLRVVPALIMAQTLYFKFGGDPSAVALFTKLGVEPWGRLGTGALEAVAALLLLLPASAFLGALLTLGLMGGALFSHLTVLGIEVENDGGLLFVLALVCAVTAGLVLLGRRRSGLALLRRWGAPLPAWLG